MVSSLLPDQPARPSPGYCFENSPMVRRLPVFRPCRVVLPPSAAAGFVRDLRAFLAESSDLRRDEIATRQLRVLEKFRLPQERELQLSDVKEMFQQMKDHA
jgi:hypothetical protein